MKHKILKGMAVVALGLLLGACGGGGPSKGTISGVVGLATAPLKVGVSGAQTQSSPDIIPGTLLVKYRAGSEVGRLSVQKLAGRTLRTDRQLGHTGIQVLRFESSGAEDTLQMASLLSSQPDVEYAQPDYKMYASKVPNDPKYGEQWHYDDISLPQAWDLTVGTGMTVAVLDTGILAGHPDLQGKLLPGYDFMSDAIQSPSADGDGRDANPEDSGTFATTAYHGTHVAGTIAAATDNKVGVAGVSWGAKILPVRVLGPEGGSLSDILDGLLWAAGEHVNGVPDNANPAQIINMSLGGVASCNDVPAYQAVFNQIAAKGIITVVAAGNSSKDASQFIPASCGNVITVGATNKAHNRASFSNFGSRIDVMAPGGDGILSLSRNDAAKTFAYALLDGTSMAAPHVAGVVALMKSVKPTLQLHDALQFLKTTATPVACDVVNGCGAGLINARKAVEAAGAIAPSPDFAVVVSAPAITLEPGDSRNVDLEIKPLNGFNKTVGVTVQGAAGKLNPAVTPMGANKFRIKIDALPGSEGNHVLQVNIKSDALEKSASINVQVNSSGLNIKGAMVIACALNLNAPSLCDPFPESQVFVVGAAVKQAPWQLSVLTNRVYVPFAWLDVNGNEDLDMGDFWGFYEKNGDLVVIRAGDTNINMPLEPYQDTGTNSTFEKQQNMLRDLIRSMPR